MRGASCGLLVWVICDFSRLGYLLPVLFCCVVCVIWFLCGVGFSGCLAWGAGFGDCCWRIVVCFADGWLRVLVVLAVLDSWRILSVWAIWCYGVLFVWVFWGAGLCSCCV